MKRRSMLARFVFLALCAGAVLLATSAVEGRAVVDDDLFDEFDGVEEQERADTVSASKFGDMHYVEIKYCVS